MSQAEQSGESDRLREQEYRLREKVKPKSPASPWSDPWLIASRALDELAPVESACQGLPSKARTLAAAHLELVAELIKRLAWGPGVPEDVEL